MSTERTLVLVKPDGVQRSLIGSIVSKVESKGLRIVGLKLMLISDQLARQHYGAHEGKPFFDGLVEFITSGPVVAIVLEGREAVSMVRNAMGATDPLNAAPGTIRGDLGLDIGRNLVHGSDSQDSAVREIDLFFEVGELVSYGRDIEKWVIES